MTLFCVLEGYGGVGSSLVGRYGGVGELTSVENVISIVLLLKMRQNHFLKNSVCF